MKDLPVIRGRRKLIAELISQGEHLQQDFKYVISDARKIARTISAFANAAGGHLLIGVKDNGTIAGVRNEEDIFVVEQAAERYCRPPQHVEFAAYSIDTGITVIKASVSPADHKPVLAQDGDGTWKAYMRVADENIKASRLMCLAWQLSDADAGACYITMGDHETAVMQLVASAETPLQPRGIALALHLSQKATDDILARLAAIGAITFTLCGDTFAITRP